VNTSSGDEADRPELAADLVARVCEQPVRPDVLVGCERDSKPVFEVGGLGEPAAGGDRGVGGDLEEDVAAVRERLHRAACIGDDPRAEVETGCDSPAMLPLYDTFPFDPSRPLPF
jgi:hypothetical protein